MLKMVVDVITYMYMKICQGWLKKYPKQHTVRKLLHYLVYM